MKTTNPQDWENRRKETGYKSATALLTDPKTMLTARGRRRLAKQRQLRYHSTQSPKYSLDKMSEKIGKMSMGSLTRTIAKCSARVKSADRILEDLAPDSQFRGGVEATRANENNMLVLATNEYKSRTTKFAVRDCRTGRVKARDAAIYGGSNV